MRQPNRKDANNQANIRQYMQCNVSPVCNLMQIFLKNILAEYTLF